MSGKRKSQGKTLPKQMFKLMDKKIFTYFTLNNFVILDLWFFLQVPCFVPHYSTLLLYQVPYYCTSTTQGSRVV